MIIHLFYVMMQASSLTCNNGLSTEYHFDQQKNYGDYIRYGDPVILEIDDYPGFILTSSDYDYEKRRLSIQPYSNRVNRFSLFKFEKLKNYQTPSYIVDRYNGWVTLSDLNGNYFIPNYNSNYMNSIFTNQSSHILSSKSASMEYYYYTASAEGDGSNTKDVPYFDGMRAIIWINNINYDINNDCAGKYNICLTNTSENGRVSTYTYASSYKDPETGHIMAKGGERNSGPLAVKIHKFRGIMPDRWECRGKY